MICDSGTDSSDPFVDDGNSDGGDRVRSRVRKLGDEQKERRRRCELKNDAWYAGKSVKFDNLRRKNPPPRW